MKNERGVIILGLIIVALVVITIIYFIADLMPDTRIINGYYNKYADEDSHLSRGYDDYFKYYYSAEYDKEFMASKEYKKVENNNIEEIKSYVNNFKDWMRAGERLDKFDFNPSIIDESDYYYIADYPGSHYEKMERYTIYYYDTQSHILYVMISEP